MLNPADSGRFFAPRWVADNLIALARKFGFSQLRISGGEPAIGKTHLLQLLDLLRDRGISFILETNGILIGYDEGYAGELSRYDFLHVRVSLKGCNEQEFSVLTGAKPGGFELQLRALKNLSKAGVGCHPSAMVSFSEKKSFGKLKERLKQIDPGLAKKIEVEELILYPHVVQRIQKYGLHHSSGYKPGKVPKEQV